MWTFASGHNDNNNASDSVNVTATSDEFACPCAVIPGLSPFAFVRNNYYCESGHNGGHVNNIYMSDALWDGSQCDGSGNNCCAETNQPWFYRQFPVAYQSDVEARICADEDYDNEGVLVDRLQLFVM